MRPTGIHEWALIGDPPESREYQEGDEFFPPDIDPSALIHAFVSVDGGLKRPTRVGARSFLMKHSHVGHDALIGADCELAPGAVVCGWAELGDNVRMGVNSCVRPYVKVGAGARIGMGAVVVKDVPAGEVHVGNPARRLVKDREAVANGVAAE